MERHGLSAPITARELRRNRRAKSDGAPGGGVLARVSRTFPAVRPPDGIHHTIEVLEDIDCWKAQHPIALGLEPAIAARVVGDLIVFSMMAAIDLNDQVSL